MTFRSHLLAPVGVTLIPLVCFAVIIVLLLHGEQRQALERGLRDTSRALAVALDREVERSIAVLEALATSEHLDSGDLKKCYAQAQRVRQSQKDWQSVALIDPSGRQLLNLAVPFGHGAHSGDHGGTANRAFCRVTVECGSRFREGRVVLRHSSLDRGGGTRSSSAPCGGGADVA